MYEALNDNSSFSDLIFICEGNTHIKAHKLLLSSVSELLKTVFVSSGRSKVYVSLPKVDGELLRTVMKLLYTGDAELKTADYWDFRKLLQLLGINHKIKDAVSGDFTKLCFELQNCVTENNTSKSSTEVGDTLENLDNVRPTQHTALANSHPSLHSEKTIFQSSGPIPYIQTAFPNGIMTDIEPAVSGIRSSLADTGSASSLSTIRSDDYYGPSFYTVMQPAFQMLIPIDGNIPISFNRQVEVGDAMKSKQILKNQDGLPQEDKYNEQFFSTSHAYVNMKVTTATSADNVETVKNLYDSNSHESISFSECSNLETATDISENSETTVTSQKFPASPAPETSVSKSDSILVGSHSNISEETPNYDISSYEKPRDNSFAGSFCEPQEMKIAVELNNQLSPESVEKCEKQIPNSPALKFILPPKKRKLEYDSKLKAVPVVQLERINLANIQKLQNSSSCKEEINQPDSSSAKEECSLTLKEDDIYTVLKSDDDDDEFLGFDECAKSTISVPETVANAEFALENNNRSPDFDASVNSKSLPEGGVTNSSENVDEFLGFNISVNSVSVPKGDATNTEVLSKSVSKFLGLSASVNSSDALESDVTKSESPSDNVEFLNFHVPVNSSVQVTSTESSPECAYEFLGFDESINYKSVPKSDVTNADASPECIYDFLGFDSPVNSASVSESDVCITSDKVVTEENLPLESTSDPERDVTNAPDIVITEENSSVDCTGVPESNVTNTPDKAINEKNSSLECTSVPESNVTNTPDKAINEENSSLERTSVPESNVTNTPDKAINEENSTLESTSVPESNVTNAPDKVITQDNLPLESTSIPESDVNSSDKVITEENLPLESTNVPKFDVTNASDKVITEENLPLESNMNEIVFSDKVNEKTTQRSGVHNKRKRKKNMSPLGVDTAPIVNKKRKAKSERKWKCCGDVGKHCH